MRKYLAIFGTSFQQESKTIANAIIRVFSFAIIIYIFTQMWRFVYTAGGANIIEGYTLEMMIWYLIGGEILAFAIQPRNIVGAYSADIKSGKIAYQINKPYNYYIYQTSNLLGQFVFKFIFIFISGLLFGLLIVGPITNFSILNLLMVIVSMLLAIITSCILYGVVGLLSFWIEDSGPFSWIIQRLTISLGVIFPPELFPGIVQKIIEYSPIYAMASGPAKLLANFDWQIFLQVTITQLAYISIFVLLSALLYKRGQKKVNINGG